MSATQPVVSDSLCVSWVSFSGPKIEGSVDFAEEILAIERFNEKSEGSRCHYGRLRRWILVTGDEDRARIWRSGTEMRKQFHAGHPVHPDIKHDDRDRVRGEVFEKERRLAKGADVQSVGLKQVADRFPD